MVKQDVRPLLHLGRRLAQGKLHRHRVVQEVVRQRTHAVGHGGREQERLAFLPTVRGDAHDVLVESHVQHAVGFVQNQDLKGRQVHIAQCQVGEHASRRDNDDVCPFRQGFLLLGEFLARSSAIDGQRRDACVIRKTLRSLIDLDGELPGGNHNQSLDLPIVGGVHDPIHGRQQKCSRFACAGLGNAQNVLALDGMGNRLSLNGCGGFKPHGPKSVLDVWVQVEVLKPNLFLFLLLALYLFIMLFFHGVKVRRNFPLMRAAGIADFGSQPFGGLQRCFKVRVFLRAAPLAP